MSAVSRILVRALLVCLLPLWLGTAPVRYVDANGKGQPERARPHDHHRRRQRHQQPRRSSLPGTRAAISSDNRDDEKSRSRLCRRIASPLPPPDAAGTCREPSDHPVALRQSTLAEPLYLALRVLLL